MEKNIYLKSSAWLKEEIVFGSSEYSISQTISRAVKLGKLRKLAPRIYTTF